MALVFGIEVNLLELVVVLAAVLIIALLALFYEVRKLQHMIDEALDIEKIHSQEKKK